MGKTSGWYEVLLCGIGLLLGGCRDGPSSAARQSFAAATDAYFAWYYHFAIGEALDPSIEEEEEQVLPIRARVRGTSRIWASTLRDSLDLVGAGFRLQFTTVPDPNKGEALGDARPGTARTSLYEGKWTRRDEVLLLTVLRVDGRDIEEPFQIEGAWRGDEIEIRGARVDSIFSSILLWRGSARDLP